MPSSPSTTVPGGLRATRSRIRALGPFIGLLPPAALGLVGALMLRGNESAARGALGFGLTVLGAPALLVFGAPLSDSARYAPAVLCSALFWFVLGVIAALRATSRPVAGWSDFWREYLWLAVPAWLGVAAAALLANLVLGQALF